MLKRIDHVNVVVSDLKAATDFFSRLGFFVQHQGNLEGPWISSIVNLENVRASYVQLSLDRSGSNLELIEFQNPRSPSQGTESKSIPNQLGIRHIAFEVDDIDALVDRLRMEGIVFFGEIQTYPATGKKLVYCYGPDGIILEFAQYRGD